jgi:hypothetical protein
MQRERAGKQCCGSVTFWYGSGSADPYLWLTDPDHLFSSKWQLKINFFEYFFAYYFLKLHLHHFLKIKSPKKSQNSRNLGFSYYFCLMIEGSGSGSIYRTNGSGAGRPQNIRNTAGNDANLTCCYLTYSSFCTIVHQRIYFLHNCLIS